MLRPGLQEELDAYSGEAVRQRIFANDFGQIFAVRRTGIIRIGHDEEESHADFVAGFAGLEIDAGAGDAKCAAHVVEMNALRIGWANAHELRDFAAAARTTLGLSAFRDWWILLKFFHAT